MHGGQPYRLTCVMSMNRHDKKVVVGCVWDFVCSLDNSISFLEEHGG